MTKHSKSAFALGASILGAGLLLAGCATFGFGTAKTTGTERSAAATLTMSLVENDIRQMVIQIKTTNASLASLLTPGIDNMTAAFADYASNVDLMDKAGTTFFDRSDKMSSQGRDYFEEWRLQGTAYSNPQIQALSEQRRTELSAKYSQIAEKSVGVQGSAKEYISKLKEIQAYFSVDLTPKGVEAISPLAQRTIVEGINLSVRLETMLKSIADVRAELEPKAAK